MEWFKLYSEARRDKKLSILTLAERGVWINLLCYASEQPERGMLDASDRFTLALECADGDEDILSSTLNKLLKVRHLIPACNDHVTSGNESVTTGVTDGRLIFRTFATRQAQKMTNFPSDDPERIRARVAAHRARRKQSVTGNEDVTSVTSGNGIEVEVDAEGEPDTPSGKGSGNSDDVVAAASAKATPLHKRQSEDVWRRVAQSVTSRLKLSPAKVSDLLALFEQYPHDPNYFTVETGKCLEWCEDNKKRPNLRTFSNWLARAEEHAQQQKQEVARRVKQNGRVKPADAAPVYTSVADSVAKVWGKSPANRSAS